MKESNEPKRLQTVSEMLAENYGILEAATKDLLEEWNKIQEEHDKHDAEILEAFERERNN